jgi:hypothetical protein
MLVALDRGEAVLDALLDGVGRRGANAGVELVVELVELLFDLGLGPAADGGAVALSVAREAERDAADVVVVDLVPPDTVVATVAAAPLRLL